MIKLQIEGKTYGVEKEYLEEVLFQQGFEQVQKSVEGMGSMKGLLNSSLGVMLPQMGFKKTEEYKHLSNVEFAFAVAFSTMVNSLDGKTIDLPVKEVEDNE